MRNLVSFGPNIRNNEAMVFRNRASSDTIVLTNRTSNFWIFMTCDRVHDLQLSPLTLEDERAGFSSQSLVNENGNIDLSSIEFHLTKEPVHTADGAIVIATMAVTFRLNSEHVAAFLNFHSRNFAETFVSRCRSALVAEIGSHKRAGLIAEQRHLRAHLEAMLLELVSGPPGDDLNPGLGIILDKVTLALEPQVSSHEGGDGNTTPITSLDSMRQVVDMMSTQREPHMQQAILFSFARLIEAHTRRETARLLGEKGRLLMLTSQELGVTGNMATYNMLNGMDAPSPQQPEDPDRPPLLMARRMPAEHTEEAPRQFLPPAA